MRITANHVTFVRLAAMPFVYVWLESSAHWGYWLLVSGITLGVTDFLDGYLARKQGPTVLGRLMDPVADKVFVAVALFPYAGRQLLPWWVVALLLTREFVVTGLRSSFERHGESLPPTFIA